MTPHAGRLARLVLALGTVLWIAQGVEGQATAGPSPDEIAKVSAQLHDPASVDAAVTEMKKWAATGKVPGKDMATDFLPRLLQMGKTQETADICLQTVLANPSSGNIQDFFSIRISALEKLDKNEEALQAAKSLYNGCDMKYIDKALPQVAHALELTHPEDKTIGRRFSLAQAQSTGKPPPATPAGAAAQPAGPTTMPEALDLKSLKIDTAIYDAALAEWSKKYKKDGTLTIDESHDIEKYANLLLVADRGAEAEKIFRELIQRTPGEAARQKTALQRALKAVDGNLSRASTAQTIANDKALP